MRFELVIRAAPERGWRGRRDPFWELGRHLGRQRHIRLGLVERVFGWLVEWSFFVRRQRERGQRFGVELRILGRLVRL